MQLLANMQRPFTALILLAACNGREATVLTGSAQTVGSSAAQIGVEDGASDPEEVDVSDPPGASTATGADAGTSEPSSVVDAGPAQPEPRCGNAVVEPGEQCDLGAENGGEECAQDCTLAPPPPPPLGACLSCAQSTCPLQFSNALGADSSEENFSVVSQLLGCVVGTDWQLGGAIPPDSCFFSDPTQPAGSMVPCYCGGTPTAQCLATGPVDGAEACGREVELASGCTPATASCVTTSGSSPSVALGDALQLLNCERVACQAECGFPTPMEE